jgi:hypothetical protein
LTGAGKLLRLCGLLLGSALSALPLHAASPEGATATSQPAVAPANAPNAPGTEILLGSDPACEQLRAELAARWQGHGFDEEPAWKDQDPDFTFPREFGDGQQANVDFYNDGKLSRVFLHYFDGPARKGSSLLVQPGRAAERVEVAASDPLEDPESWLIPCQLQGKRFPLSQCPPLSDRNDDTGLTVSWADHTRHLHFSSRYMDLALARLNDTTFVVVTGTSPETRDFAAVLKPLPYRTFRTTCVLHRR